MPPGSSERLVRESMFAGDASKISPAASGGSPLYPSTSAAMDGGGGISARSGVAVGRNIPTVRLEGLR